MLRTIDETWLHDGLQQLLIDLPLPLGVPGGMEKFRQTLALSFFFKFYTTMSNLINNRQCDQLNLTDVDDANFETTQIYRVRKSQKVNENEYFVENRRRINWATCGAHFW